MSYLCVYICIRRLYLLQHQLYHQLLHCQQQHPQYVCRNILSIACMQFTCVFCTLDFCDTHVHTILWICARSHCINASMSNGTNSGDRNVFCDMSISDFEFGNAAWLLSDFRTDCTFDCTSDCTSDSCVHQPLPGRPHSMYLKPHSSALLSFKLFKEHSDGGESTTLKNLRLAMNQQQWVYVQIHKWWAPMTLQWPPTNVPRCSVNSTGVW